MRRGRARTGFDFGIATGVTRCYLGIHRSVARNELAMYHTLGLVVRTFFPYVKNTQE